jgi:uncharacterized membrane protein
VDSGAPVPVITPNTIRTALSIAALLVVARLLERHRDSLLEGERGAVPPLALFAAHASLALWLAVHAGRIAMVLTPADAYEQRTFLGGALSALAWSVQGAGLVVLGLGGRRGTRMVGYGLLAFAGGAAWIGSLPLLWNNMFDGGIHGGDFARWHLGSLTLLLAFVPVLLMIDRATRDRDRLAPGEFGVLKFVTAGTLVTALLWSSCEVGLLARNFLPPGDVAVNAWASGAWTVLAILVFTLGWFRGSPFVRWLGIGTLGLTILKLLLFDLARVGAFWRFVTAIAVGCVLLARSYVDQRARRRAGPDAGEAEEPVEVAPGRGNP